MSVDLNIRYTDSELDDELPIAAYLTFNEYWLEPSKTLGLELIPLMGSLITDDKSAITDLVSDLIKLRDYLISSGKIDPNDSRHVLRRMQAAIDALEKALINWDKIKYVSCG